MYYWQTVAAFIVFVLSLGSTLHLILYKRDPRAALSWIVVIWLTPVLGVVLYSIFGINRIRRKAQALKGPSFTAIPIGPSSTAKADLNPARFQASFLNFKSYMDNLTGRALTPGNSVTPLLNGEEAFPAMLEAIRKATSTISFSTYIFDRDPLGMEFVEALREAQERNVHIRVLLDDFGIKYSFPPIIFALRRHRIPTARFLPAWVPWHLPFFNLRNHRKILIIDGQTAFTGGMNIRQGHLLLSARPERKKIQDLHFKLEGPVISQMQEIFAKDWAFATKEILSGDKWFPPPPQGKGKTLARGIFDGPDGDFEKIRWTLMGAIHMARTSIRILTPYFLPDPSLMDQLNVCAQSGIKVQILLPEKNNLLWVQWAMMAMVWQPLEKGCEIRLSPPPFDHSKLVIIDEEWCLFGSTNWDPRSLRLNFEFNIECWDQELAQRLLQIFEDKFSKSRRLTYEMVEGRFLPERLRDGLARLFYPIM